MARVDRASTMALGGRQSSTRRSWMGAVAAAAWIGVALLTVLWSDQPGTEWDYTGDLAAAFAALGAALALATFADFWFACVPRVQRVAPWMLVLAALVGAWEMATAKLGLL